MSHTILTKMQNKSTPEQAIKNRQRIAEIKEILSKNS